jgi:type III secretory pathway component EscR
MELIPDYLINIMLIFCCTAFVKVATVLTIARYGIGLNDFVFGWITVILSLLIALVIVKPWTSNLPAGANFYKQAEHFNEFLKKHSDSNIEDKINNALNTRKNEQPEGDKITNEKVSIEVSLVSFLLTELKSAFQLGLYILIPFIVIDILLINIFMLLGITQVSVSLVAFPIKIFAFLSVDGWNLITEKLLLAYS